VNDRFGFIDTLGNIKIEPEYTYASQFSENLAVVHLGAKAGYIDTNGNLLIARQFDHATQFKNGVAIVGHNKKYGLIDGSGNLIVGYLYDWLTPSLINENRIGFKNDGRWGYLSMEGVVLIDNKYESISMFNNGTAKVEINGFYGVIDSSGKYLLEPKYQMIRGQSFFDNRIAVRARGNDKFHYVDMKGNKVTKAKFTYVSWFSEGKAFVKENYGELGYFIDTMGNKIFDSYQYGGLFKSGLAVVQKDGKYGIIDTEGKYIVPPKYDELSSFFQCGFIISIKREGNKYLYGLIGLNGNEITKLKYSRILIDDGDCIYPELYKNGEDSYDRSGPLEYVNRDGKIIWK
jgi:hypothetical protein